ncbi:MAG: zf-HC2 domain-containing protein [Candidatus Lambdaproteobacteria bacterium]|nr:zf-HC2 domain-containing protein [Candidatus Lambdaproteobacteria bacterium]
MELLKDCQEIYDFLIEYQERTLPFLERVRFNLHLLMCGNCAAYLKAYSRSGEIFRAALRDDPPPPELMELTLNFLRTHSRS